LFCYAGEGLSIVRKYPRSSVDGFVEFEIRVWGFDSQKIKGEGVTTTRLTSWLSEDHPNMCHIYLWSPRGSTSDESLDLAHLINQCKDRLLK
jgi:hypothetical protein